MDAQIWFTLSIVGYSLGGLLLIVAIIMFYKMGILAIYNDLTGKTAERKIREIRESTENAHRNYSRVTQYDPVSTNSPVTRGDKKQQFNTPTAKTSTAQEVFVEDATELLVEETTLLASDVIPTPIEETTVLGAQYGTTVLRDEGTTVLDEGMTKLNSVTEDIHEEFVLEKEVIAVHTNETIGGVKESGRKETN
ncbi:hypothetical protein ACH0B5_06515 [Ureibacillus sp. 179-F W5.1 NHS]|uniref:Uncharacterized protein n=1 Tax=Lysinibacillus halotolerans TaxID=1368476 RepID=A0A3M8HBK9_9BACI|nr:hypothetical protein [Lysinibacillus halotolerans]RNC99813.1 hypothetical protein EC501_06810 [Lysinibacillus halotolerans]